MRISKGRFEECKCGALLKNKCAEGHNTCEIVNWYIPKDSLIRMINKNIQRIFKDNSLDYNLCILADRGYIINNVANMQENVDILFGAIECFKHDPISLTKRLKAYAVNMNEKCGETCSHSKAQECINNNNMVCLPKIFYTILPGYRPQPHKGGEYGDVSGEVKVGNRSYELKGIIKKTAKINLERSLKTMKK